VSVDLNGFGVGGSGGGPTCNVSSGTAGNSCTIGLSGNVGLTITGSEVIVKNGTVFSGFNNGILISGTTARQDVVLQDLTISDFEGSCVIAQTAGLRMVNVSTTKCGQYGIFAGEDVTLINVTSSNNNSDGIAAQWGVLDHVNANYNKGSGINIGAVSIDHVLALSNLGNGISHKGVVRGAVASQNGGAGVIAVAGASAVVEASVAGNNTGNGFTFPTLASCYLGLATVSNGGAAVSGGTGLAGSVANCP